MSGMHPLPETGHTTLAELEALSREMHKQDNLATAHPMFNVEDVPVRFTSDFDIADGHTWVNPEEDWAEADEKEAAILDAMEEKTDTSKLPWVKLGVIRTYRFVTACFTRKAAQEYIDANRHNLNEPRIYVASAHRNYEFQLVRDFLLSLAESKASDAT